MKIRPISKEAIIISVLIFALLGLYSLDRTRLGHSVPDEKRYLQSTKEMVEAGDYLTPRYHGRLRFQKPILFYWLIIAAYKIFGVGIFGARFPSIAAALLSVILVYFLGRDLFNKKAGIFSALALSTSEVFFTYSRFAVPDMTFLLFITASLYFFVRAYRGGINGRFRYLYMYFFMALAMLTKGPLGFIYPMAVICVFLIARKEWKVFRKINFPLGFLLFAAVSAPWFIMMIFMHGASYLENVWQLEIMKKLKYFTFGSNGNLFMHYLRTTLYYTGMIFARFLPWSLFLIASLVSHRNAAFKRSNEDFAPKFVAAYFLVIFAGLVLIWSKESYYVLGLSVPLSLLLGRYFSAVTEDARFEKSFLFRFPFISAIIIFSLAIIAWLVLANYILGERVFSFSLFMLAIPITMAMSYVRRNRILMPLGFFAASFACFAYLSGHVIPLVDQESLLKVAEEIKELIEPGDVVGVASGDISYHRLNVPLRDYMVIRADKRPIFRPADYVQDKSSKGLINEFLLTDNRRVFCVITKDDYYGFVDEDLRDKSNILDRTFIWKRFHKQNKEYFKTLFRYFLNGEKELLRQALKEEIYLVSNR